MEALKDLLGKSNLGVGMVAAMTCGEKLLSTRLQHCSVAVQEQLWKILAEKLATREVSPSNLIQLRLLLCQLLTQEDWEAMATAAANNVRQEVMASAVNL
ncbi:MAG TPA: hypothetical protein DEG17_17340 [Cyanobacteria bacterium UBA11149]|nr:hypothetical protein [Cyanobacteria bacterium UBA11367]HBE57361.1 hypothetical protein [Cyanobacteria bacterium UBA11366]HBK66985.1 hypothetical protein [Cyanobacteria bacterium UBA11166]HBR76827.1 hypothetical protein [Cyanobacteria bacterium UBA11159]HBS72584.1 hypothetical protein [Cyanobacteria bacterium UBA11153]HBW90587.1 hypothetical protein [Cyanobacteria bacterium UBA11149]HCA94893.1 hypothetical protein [Cyanobacteria bacterium UBA9226]